VVEIVFKIFFTRKQIKIIFFKNIFWYQHIKMIRKHQKKYFKRIVLKNIFKIQKQTAPRYVISWKNDLTMSGLTTKHPFKFRGYVNLSLDYLFIIFESFQFFFSNYLFLFISINFTACFQCSSPYYVMN
jgi:hypothetical protein